MFRRDNNNNNAYAAGGNRRFNGGTQRSHQSTSWMNRSYRRFNPLSRCTVPPRPPPPPPPPPSRFPTRKTGSLQSNAGAAPPPPPPSKRSGSSSNNALLDLTNTATNQQHQRKKPKHQSGIQPNVAQDENYVPLKTENQQKNDTAVDSNIVPNAAAGSHIIIHPVRPPVPRPPREQRHPPLHSHATAGRSNMVPNAIHPFAEFASAANAALTFQLMGKFKDGGLACQVMFDIECRLIDLGATGEGVHQKILEIPNATTRNLLLQLNHIRNQLAHGHDKSVRTFTQCQDRLTKQSTSLSEFMNMYYFALEDLQNMHHL